MPLVTRFSNQGQLFKEATTPNWLDGDIWSDTTANNVKVNVGGVATDIGATSFSNSTTVSYSQTIGDYTNPTMATATSSTVAEAELYTDNGAVNYVNMVDSGQQGAAVHIETSSSMIGRVLKTCKFDLRKTGSPTGNMTIKVLDSSFVQKELITTVDVSTFTTSVVEYTYSAAQTTVIAAGDYIALEYTAGDASNYVMVFGTTGSTNANAVLAINTSGSWADSTGNDMNAHLVFSSSAVYVMVDDTSIFWQSNAETNPAIYLDLGGAATNCLGMAIYLHANTTETEIQIRMDATTSFTSADARRTITVSNLTAGAWNYIRWNLKTLRYLQVYGNSGNSSVLAISEIKYLTKTDSEILRDLGIISISATDTNLALDGT